MKTKIHDMTNLISEVYVENDTQFSWPIRSGADYDEYQIGNYMTNNTNVVYAKNEVELSLLIELGLVSDENQIGEQRDWS